MIFQSIINSIVNSVDTIVYGLFVILFLALSLYIATFIIGFRKRTQLHESIKIFPRCLKIGIQLVILGAILGLIFLILFISAVMSMLGSSATNPLQAIVLNSSLGDISSAIFATDLTAGLLVLAMILLILLVFAYAIKEQLKLEYKWALLLIILTFIIAIGIALLFELVFQNSLMYYFNEIGSMVENFIGGLLLSE